jgi:hypothetical protein
MKPYIARFGIRHTNSKGIMGRKWNSVTSETVCMSDRRICGDEFHQRVQKNFSIVFR